MNNNRVNYIVIKDKGIVRATITECEYDAFAEFNVKFMFPSSGYLTLLPCDAHDKFIMPYQFTAVAKLHPEDEWDEEVGKKIALKKLTEKYNQSLDKHMANMYDVLSRVMDKAAIYLDERGL